MNQNHRTAAESPSAGPKRQASHPRARSTMAAEARRASAGTAKISRAGILRDELSVLARADGGLLLDLDCRRGHFIVKSHRKHVLLGYIPSASRWAHAHATESDHRQTARRCYRDAMEKPRRLDLERRSEFFDATHAHEDARLRKLAAQTAASLLAQRSEEVLERLRRACTSPDPAADVATWIGIEFPGENAPEFREYVAHALFADPATRHARDPGQPDRS